VRDFRFEVFRDGPLGMDSFLLRVVADEADGLDAMLAARVKGAIGVTPTVQHVASLDSTSWKAKRWVDQRG
jgi:hypothetical protein